MGNELPTFTLDLRSELNCFNVEHAMPGRDLGIMVRRVAEADEPGILARGALSDDRRRFYVMVVANAGRQTYDWSFDALVNAIRGKHRGEAQAA
jgi:hypothetical protein